MVLDQKIHRTLWTAPTTNRMNFVIAFIVLLAGTGADNRTTSWSVNAIERYAGIGKRRGRHAIAELAAAKLAVRVPDPNTGRPRYKLAPPECKDEPIFLPVPLVTGLKTETPIIRRVRETGDPMLLRMLLDLYGQVQIDPTQSVPLEVLHASCDEANATAKVGEHGVNTLWALGRPDTFKGHGAWRDIHGDAFWSRLDMLLAIGAISFDDWVFDGAELDAEPLFPVDAPCRDGREVPSLEALAHVCASIVFRHRRRDVDRYNDCVFVMRPSHCRPPALRGVGRLQVLPDTPGMRAAYARYRNAVEAWEAAYSLYSDHPTPHLPFGPAPIKALN